ncbi:SMI1/KNR4 family protein [Kribbella karoonensis]|uniref:Knr4/Smi1-like domain-containing protein n=1 Tax=Kribbella karoonensis TaxID=324851 RepID=A0ABN2DAQ9_9ACTN
MTWRTFYLVRDDLHRRSDAEVDAAEAALGLPLPRGYREMMTELGDGEVSGVLRAYAPDRIAGEQAFYQELIDTAWFFENLEREYARECVVLADTGDGDQLIFHPEHDQLHVLPRDDERTHPVGNDLWQAVAWFQTSGVLMRPHPFRYFEPFVGPVEAANGTGEDQDRIQAAIEALDLHNELEANDHDRTYFVKAIGGYISVSRSGERANVHLKYCPDKSPAVRTQLWDAAAAAGVAWGPTWLSVK